MSIIDEDDFKGVSDDENDSNLLLDELADVLFEQWLQEVNKASYTSSERHES